MSNWEKWTKKYVWDTDKTPFFIAIDNLTKLQAKRELFLYIIFVGTPFGVLAFISLIAISRTQNFGYLVYLIYSITILSALYLLITTKNQYSAFYVATAPIALILHLYINGFPSKLHEIEECVLLVFLLLWLKYGMRIIRMTKHFPEMEEGIPKPPLF